MYVGFDGLLGAFKCGMVLIMVWGCLSYTIFDEDINENNSCTTAYQCIALAVDAGLHGDMAGLHGDNYGNIFPSFPERFEENLHKHPVQWLFVLCFFLMWEFVLGGIVQVRVRARVSVKVKRYRVRVRNSRSEALSRYVLGHSIRLGFRLCQCACRASLWTRSPRFDQIRQLRMTMQMASVWCAQWTMLPWTK